MLRTQFTFAQTLSEEMKAATQALLVVSIPASSEGTGASPTAGVHDEEVGGAKGREALARLMNVFQRIVTQWRPAIVVSSPESEGDLVEFGGRDFESGEAEELAEVGAAVAVFEEGEDVGGQNVPGIPRGCGKLVFELHLVHRGATVANSGAVPKDC